MSRMWILLATLMPSLALADVPTQGTQPVAPPVLIPNTAVTKQYDPRAGFPDANGPFSAMLVVIPQAELAQFGQEGDGSRQLDKVSRAEAGAVLAIKLLFIGAMPDWNGNANVSYDLQVYAPNGAIYAGSDYRSLEALRTRVDDGEGVYDNRSKVVLMQFEDADAPGVYTLRATLHDNVAKRDIPLQTTVELLPKVRAASVVPDAQSITLPPDVTAALTGDAKATKAAPAKGKKGKRRKRHH